MSSNKSAEYFSVDISFSTTKLLLVVLPHGVCLFILLFVLDLPLDLQIISIITLWIFPFAIACSCFYFSKLHLSQNLNTSILQIQKSGTDEFNLTLYKGVLEKGVKIESSFISNYLIIINFKNSMNKLYTAVIPAGSVNNDDFRKLKVILKTRRVSI